MVSDVSGDGVVWVVGMFILQACYRLLLHIKRTTLYSSHITVQFRTHTFVGNCMQLCMYVELERTMRVSG